jgi:hypothetical protein
MAGNVNINEVLQIGSIGGSTGNCKLVVYSSDSYGNAAIFKHPDDTRGLAIRYNEIIATNANNDFNMTVSGTGRLLFNSGGSLRMRITNTGNVGIGTDPSQKLEVDGVLKLVGNPNPVNDNIGVYLWNQANVGPTISGASFEVRTGGDIARMRILNNGNAGIGTTDPQHKLDIQGSAAQTLRIMDTRATGDAIIALKETNDNNGFDMAYIGTAGDRFYIRGYNNSATPRVDFTIDRITSNVGIGMTDPKYKLDVAGTINASNILINGSIVTANNQQWITSSSNVYTSNLSGNVGIGTTAPQSKLTINPIVSQNNYFNHSEAPLTITNPTPTSSTVINDPKSVLHLCRDGTGGQAYGARASFKLCRYENSFPNSRSRLDITLAHNEYDDINTMSILSNGGVGIGRTNPTELLHVNGNFKAEGSIVSGSGADMLSGNHIFTTATSGRLGIGINPNTPTTSIAHLHRTTTNTEVKLQFTDGTTLSTATDGLTLYKGTDQIGYLWNYENADLVFGTNSTERMRITSGGNVGIGTTNPNYKLDIQGSTAQTLRIMDTRSAGEAIIALKELNDNNGFDMAYIGTTGDKFYIRGYNNSATPRVDFAIDRITSNVGIGMTDPKYKLDVAGTINASNILINGSIISASSSQWITTGTNIYNNNTGNVGIGTTAPNSVLDIVRTSASGVAVDMLNTRFDNNWGLKVQQNYVGAGDIRYNLIHRYNAIDYNSLTFKGANVGIGTNNPLSLLDINTTSYTGAILTLDAGIINATTQMPRSIGKPLMKLGKTSYSTTAGDYYGIGFGYSPLPTDFNCAEIGVLITSVSGAETGDIVFSTRPNTTNVAPTERMRIASNGNVGIGTNNPSAYTLQVNGTIGASGNITASYSDERLKNITEYVSDVLPILNKINVFKYNCNDLAASYGYDKNKKEIGLSAQEVQKYYPEVVSIAPFDSEYDEETKNITSKSGENYLTLDYERLVPILLQGIKDLNNKVVEMEENEIHMKNELNNIKSRLDKLELR